ncbi:flavodoxin domain-containing protein [Streptomyces sp. CC210A]|uniref:flavodoxin domain-containing protein n=1 Tax=Streptomyces sp. CC210A TaxID=2898184 RepID=UPI001F31845B|nr:flavodoxin domain-containing protein [Streptomyces sp. CC210A]
MTSVLVGYATAHGSTRSIAERIAARLSDGGLRAVTRPLDALTAADLDAYDAYVVGSAVHDMAWLPEARRFTDAHGAALARHPLWIFSVGMADAVPGPRDRVAALEERKITGKLVERLHLRGRRLFSGVIAPEHLTVPGRLKMKAMGIRYGDYRDWDAVDAWAAEITAALGSAEAA